LLRFSFNAAPEFTDNTSCPTCIVWPTAQQPNRADLNRPYSILVLNGDGGEMLLTLYRVMNFTNRTKPINPSSPAHMMFTMMKTLQEDETTAYSSWNGSESLSSYCSGKDTGDIDEQLDEDHSLRDPSPTPTESLHRTILTERAAMLMRRESSIGYSESSYVEDDATAHLDKLSLQSDARACGQSSADSVNLIIRIDLECRSKMMQWAISVVEFSYPPPPDLANNRKHSVETLHIVSSAFAYVDQVMAQQQNGPEPRKKPIVQSRKEYKLLCMISLHLAAKMSGLFSRGDHEYVHDTILEPETSSSPMDVMKDRMKSRAGSMTSICTATTTCSSSNSSPDETACRAYSRVTPDERSRAPPSHTIKPRPLLHLLSFTGLLNLCQGEFSIEDMCNMELSILSTLEWRLNGGLLLEWLSLLLECMAYCQSYGVTKKFDLNEIKEHSLAHLEAAVKSSAPMAKKPFDVARSALASAIKVILEATRDDGGDELSLMQTFLRVLGMG
jgi:hypothetical protein